ncbi:hypothetical protein ONZ45_g14784 [Pleurotus djamor]|nr:hypothetical protein ONZ45_g14784 [Pleurotus djamor]
MGDLVLSYNEMLVGSRTARCPLGVGAEVVEGEDFVEDEDFVEGEVECVEHGYSVQTSVEFPDEDEDDDDDGANDESDDDDDDNQSEYDDELRSSDGEEQFDSGERWANEVAPSLSR